MLIYDPNHNFSDFSKTTNENTRQFGVPTVFESSVSHVSHDGSALRIESKRKHAIGKPLPDREIKEREGFVISGAESMSKKGQRNGISVRRVSENSILMDEISKNIFNEELNKLL